MDERSTVNDQGWGVRWPRYEGAELGFRHYWYPVLESRRLRKRPRAVTLLGEKIVLVRAPDGVHALDDRCPHRGVPLSMGRCVFSGMITCAYHGWTFDVTSGELVAALTDHEWDRLLVEGSESCGCRCFPLCV